jgi:two-component system sensor histidine kinase PilS (NtrC family)
MPDSTLRRKLLYLVVARAIVVTLLLGSAILVRLESPASLPVDPFFFVIALTYALTVVYSLLLGKTTEHQWIAEVQLVLDALIVSALVCLTGGIFSYFHTLYTLPIIAASTIRSRRGGVVVGLLSSVIYIGIVLAQYAGLPAGAAGGLSDALPPMQIAIFNAGLNVFGFLAVAALSGYLAEGLRRADAQLQRASNQISDLQAFSQHVIDSLASGLATTDVEGRISTFNSAAESITGLTAAGVAGQSVAHVLQWPDGLSTLFGPGEAERSLPRVEFELTRADGRRIDLGLSTAILRTPRGATGFVFTFRDVTDVRREERAARVQHRLAAVGEMAAGIAHEIRNPLASMSGSIQILRQELPLTGEQSQLLDIVIRESERLNETIGSFLDYARPQRKPAVRVDVRAIVTDTAALLQNSAERLPTHTVTVDVPPDPACCLADEAQIRQVVWNLASNALRAMPDGGLLRMTVATSGADAHLTIAVRDEGVGIAPADLEEILQPFRGGFARGTGLGLSIVHRIISDYGGDLQVTSRLEEGTTVTVQLPRCSDQLPALSLQPGAERFHTLTAES